VLDIEHFISGREVKVPRAGLQTSSSQESAQMKVSGAAWLPDIAHEHRVGIDG
jgi:hypothetical protein